MFLAFSRLKMPLFDRKSRMCLRAVLRYPVILSRFASRLSISHQPKLLVKNRPNATENRPTLTQNRPDQTILCHFATLLRHSVHDTNSDLRRIACDFLTSSNRVGGIRFAALRRVYTDRPAADPTVAVSAWFAFDFVFADPRSQHLRYEHRAVGLLVVLEDRDDRARAGDGGAVERVDELRALLAARTVADV